MYVAWYVAYPLCKVICSMLSPNQVIAKDVKWCTYCWYVRYVILIVWVGKMYWPKTCATHYHAQVLTSRRGMCNQRVGCLQWLDLEPLDELNDIALGCYQPSPKFDLNIFFPQDYVIRQNLVSHSFKYYLYRKMFFKLL